MINKHNRVANQNNQEALKEDMKEHTKEIMDLKELLKEFLLNIMSLDIVNLQLISPNTNNPQPTMSTSGNPQEVMNLPLSYTSPPIYRYLIRVKLELSKFNGN